MPAPLAGFALAAALRTAAQKTTYRVAGKALAKKAVKKTAKANARGLKAANKPTNKVGSKADKEIRSSTKSVVLSKEETAALQNYYYGQPNLTQVLSRKLPKNDARSVRKFTPTPKKKSAVQLRPKKK